MIKIKKSGLWWHLYTMTFEGEKLPTTHRSYILLLIVSLIVSLVILPVTILRIIYRIFTCYMNKIIGDEVFDNFYGIIGSLLTIFIVCAPLTLSNFISSLEGVGLVGFILFWVRGFIMLFLTILLIFTILYILILIKSKMKRSGIVIRYLKYKFKLTRIRIKRKLFKLKRYLKKFKRK